MFWLFPRCIECRQIAPPMVWFSTYERERVVPLDKPLARCPACDPIMRAVLGAKEKGVG